MKKNILLPTDFSDNAWNAAVYALKLYAEEACTFHFMHSIKMTLSTLANPNTTSLEIMKKNAMKELLDLQEMAHSSNCNPNHDFRIILCQDELQAGIDASVKKHQIDVIVIGKKGATAAKGLFFGGNTIRTLKKMRLCPILIIPEDYDFVLPKQIAFPTDYNRFFGDDELRPLKDLAELNNSKIRIVHINVEPHLSDLQEYNLTMLKSYLEDYELSFHWMPNYAKKTNEIMDFIKDLKIDLLAMVNYKHSFIENMTREPVIKYMGSHPPVPFLVIPE